jgi:hypothetical protein
VHEQRVVQRLVLARFGLQGFDQPLAASTCDSNSNPQGCECGAEVSFSWSKRRLELQEWCMRTSIPVGQSALCQLRGHRLHDSDYALEV